MAVFILPENPFRRVFGRKNALELAKTTVTHTGVIFGVATVKLC
jgi:hypothetical protein